MAKNKVLNKDENPKRTPMILCTILQTIGWLLLIDVGLLFITTLLHPGLGAFEDSEPFQTVLSLTQYWFSIDFFFIGISAVILGQLARFIFQKTDRPGLLLRHSNIILIFFACLILFWALLRYLYDKPSQPERWGVFLLAFLFPALVKAFMLILTAQILKRIIPIIEESKTLV
jgi:hypothetical protein